MLAAIEDLRRGQAKIEGKRDALRERQEALVRDVGLAKGRVALKGQIEAFIDDLQAEAYRRSTHSFETLLTTLVREVLPESNPVALELTTERSAPSLNISSVGKSGAQEDIFEDHGGALSNVISMGLRLIATVKSGTAKFLALDEPECWTKPDRVPAFFRVLEDASRRLGVQCVTITHHDAAANFDQSVRISTLTGHPETGATIACSDPATEWPADAEGFRYIRMQNFQGFVDARMDLGPGVNALVGPNDHGKSSVIRALRAVFYGETRDSLIRHGCKETTVEIGIGGGRVVRFSRELKRNPKNLWTLVDATGTVVEENGLRHETGGNNPPEWLNAQFGIVKGDKDKLDIHLAHQKFPVFLLDKPGPMRAKVLSIGQEAGYTQDMLAVHKERASQDSALIREGERDVGLLAATLGVLAELPELAADIEWAEQYATSATEWDARLTGLERHHAAIVDAKMKLAVARAKGAAFADLPSDEDRDAIIAELDGAASRSRVVATLKACRDAAEQAAARAGALATLPDAAPTPANTAQLEEAVSRLRSIRSELTSTSQRLEVADDLPPAAPALEDTTNAGSVAAALRELRSRVGQARASLATIDAQMGEMRVSIDDVLDDGGGHCPTCGHLVGLDDLLNHTHQLEAAE